MEILRSYIENSNNDYKYLLLGIILFILIAYYILFSISVKKLSNRLKKEDRWMSFIPYLNIYYFAHIIGSNLNGIIMLLLLSLMSLILNKIIIVLLFIAFIILFSVTIDKIYKKYYDNCESITILTAISLTVLGPILLFKNRNKNIRSV